MCFENKALCFPSRFSSKLVLCSVSLWHVLLRISQTRQPLVLISQFLVLSGLPVGAIVASAVRNGT